MTNEKPLALKILGWVLYLGGTAIKTMFEMSTPESTESFSSIYGKYERGEIGTMEYLERKSQSMGS